MNTLRSGKKKLRIKKYPDTYERVLSVKAVAKLNLGQDETFEIKKKISRCGLRSLDNA